MKKIDNHLSDSSRLIIISTIIIHSVVAQQIRESLMQKNIVSLLLWLVCVSLLTACSSSKNTTRFYALTPVAEKAKIALPALSLGVGPIKIPRLLRRPQLVVRKNATEIVLVEGHQWGGSLREDILATLSRNLAIFIDSDAVKTYPWKHDNQPDYQIRLKIDRFDGTLGQELQLKVHWSLLQRNKRLSSHYETITLPIKGMDYNTYVATQSQAIEQLAHAIYTRIYSCCAHKK